MKATDSLTNFNAPEDTRKPSVIKDVPEEFMRTETLQNSPVKGPDSRVSINNPSDPRKPSIIRGESRVIPAETSDPRKPSIIRGGSSVIPAETSFPKATIDELKKDDDWNFE